MTLTFNRVHKNGWVSFKIAGVTGAVFVDRRMLTPEQLHAVGEGSTIEVNGLEFAAPQANATEKAAEKAAKAAEREAAKAAKATAAAEKAQAKIAKLQEAAKKAQERAEAQAAKLAGKSAPAAADAQ